MKKNSNYDCHYFMIIPRNITNVLAKKGDAGLALTIQNQFKSINDGLNELSGELSDQVISNTTKVKEVYDEIIVKMDVESSEYDILEKLVNESSIKCIDRLFVEFHTNWMKESKSKDNYILREKELINILPKLTNFHIWV